METELLKCLSAETVAAIAAAKAIREETISPEMARALLSGVLRDEMAWWSSH